MGVTLASRQAIDPMGEKTMREIGMALVIGSLIGCATAAVMEPAGMGDLPPLSDSSFQLRGSPLEELPPESHEAMKEYDTAFISAEEVHPIDVEGHEVRPSRKPAQAKP